MGARNLSDDPVTVDVVFDRFPASVRGAVVVRGADANPHQTVLTSLNVVEVRAPGRALAPVAVDQATVDLAPRREVFLPFELPFAELGPGWYGIVAQVLVDGLDTVKSAVPGKLFSVAWPSGTVRRGTVDVGKPIEVPGTASIDRVECKADRAVVRWQHQPAEAEPELKVLADGKPLPTIEGTNRDGSRTTVVYPVLKAHHRLLLRIEKVQDVGQTVRGPWELEVPLG
ncbi:MAG TPA: hypothetical protein VE754_05195 [Actinomycetota bacterium]|nr:hypothetical protein [Actinomycetota bacterium]